MLFPNLSAAIVIILLTSSWQFIIHVLKPSLVFHQLALDVGCGDNKFQDTPYLLR
jgi:hypothetical protein